MPEVPALRDNPETLRFGLHSRQDALDLAKQVVEDGDNRLFGNQWNVLKSYEGMEIELVLELSPGSEGKNLHLVFSAIPNWSLWNRQGSFGRAHISSKHRENASSERNHDFVFIGITNLIKQPQQIIPSEVRLEPAKQRLDFFRQIFGASKSISHLVNTSSERERSEFWISLSGSYSNRESGSVESTTKVPNQVPQDIANGLREWFGEFKLKNLKSGPVRIVLGNLFVGIEIDERFNSLFKVGKVFLSPRDLATRTCESV